MLEENIRVMRKEKGLTQEQLAEVMGVSTASVSKWETGVAVPELGMLAALADFFEMSIDALIGHTLGKEQLKEKTDAATSVFSLPLNSFTEIISLKNFPDNICNIIKHQNNYLSSILIQNLIFMTCLF